VTNLQDRLVRHVAAAGPIAFSEFLDQALYDPALGFYGSGTGRAGRRGDFITSPEVGPLFGAVVAAALDRWWVELGRPDRFQVVEVGAGRGALARSVLAAAPSCAAALDLVLVERSAPLRDLHPQPPRLTSRASMPPPSGMPSVVLANELLDNLPFDLAEQRADGEGWDEIRVGVGGGALAEVRAPLDPRRSALLERLVPDAAPGSRVPLQAAAGAWLEQALALAGAQGRVVVLDYAATTPEMADRPWLDWVRTYRSHHRGGHPLDAPGTQDVTCEVAVDQLALVRPPQRDLSQAEWLRLHGIGELVEEGKAIWAERAAIGDLAAVRARSRVGEAEALTDPAGLGAFRVLEWLSRSGG
jgi:SAM-dependent MidA family methyltransferase